jgi:hypothetical protein
MNVCDHATAPARFGPAFLVEGLVCAVGAIMIIYGAQSSTVLLVTGPVGFVLGGVAGAVLLVSAQRGKSS